LKRNALFLLALLIATPVFADVSVPLNVEEEDGSPSAFPFKIKITNGSLTDNGDGTVSLSTGGSGETNTASNVGTGVGVWKEKNLVDLRFKSLVSGDNIVITQDSNSIRISTSGAGEANTASNVGNGIGWWKEKSSVDLRFKSVVSGDNVTMTQDANSVRISVPTATLVDGSDATSFVLIADDATGNVALKTDAGITYNASTGALSATSLTEGANAVFNSTEVPGGELGGTWASPTIDDSLSVSTWTLTTPSFSGKTDYDAGSVNDDDCTGEQGLMWYDDTDLAFEFCNADSGTPTTLGVSSGGTGYIQLPVQSLKLPTNAVSIDASELTWKALYDDGVPKAGYWNILVPGDYSSSPVLRVNFSMTSATSNNVVWVGRVMTITSGDSADVDTLSFDTSNSQVVSVPGTAGHLKQFTITLSNNDSISANDHALIYISRDASHASDSASGNAELVGTVSFEYSKS